MLRSFLCAILASAVLTPQLPPGAEIKVASVQVRGNQRYTAEEIARLSGVEIGKPATPADFTAAASLLASTGLFDSVRYTYTTGRVMTVTFDVAEAAWTIPVVFDNFVWLPDDQLTAALRAEVPSFDGTAPLNAGAAEFIRRALDNVLKTRGIPGRVDFTAQGKLGGSVMKYLFAVKDPSPKLCALHFAGTSGIGERDLVGALQAAIGDEYSRFFVSTAAEGTLTDIYRRKGFWRASFATPIAALDSCPGVAVTVPVTEGVVYAWDHAEWSGNQALNATALDRALAMKSGEVADSGRIDVGLRAVHTLYGVQGYVTQRASIEPRLDDATRRAVFAIAIEEGPQYHMGVLTFEGIRDADGAMLSRKWKLKQGDVYDESYVRTFEREELLPLRTVAGARGGLETHLDAARRMIDVNIVFK